MNHDHDDAGAFDFEQTITRTYRRVVGEAAPGETIARRDAFAEVVERVMPLIDSGDLKLDPTELILATLAGADDRDAGLADRTMRRIARGERSLDLDDDPILDVIVRLGDGRRKLWRHVDVDDLRDMDRLRYKNFRDATNAYDAWRADFDRALPIVREYGTVGAAYDADAFEDADT